LIVPAVEEPQMAAQEAPKLAGKGYGFQMVFVTMEVGSVASCRLEVLAWVCSRRPETM
jgi:hypothetical protein